MMTKQKQMATYKWFARNENAAIYDVITTRWTMNQLAAYIRRKAHKELNGDTQQMYIRRLDLKGDEHEFNRIKQLLDDDGKKAYFSLEDFFLKTELSSYTLIVR